MAPDKSCLRCSNYKLDCCIGPTQSKAHKLLHTCTNTQHTYTRTHTHTRTHQHTCIHTQREMIHTICMYTCTHVQYTSQQVHICLCCYTLTYGHWQDVFTQFTDNLVVGLLTGHVHEAGGAQVEQEGHAVSVPQRHHRHQLTYYLQHHLFHI